MSETKKTKILYLHGRPSPHPLHGSFANVIGGEFQYIDKLFRWQDRNYGPLLKLFAWFINCFAFKNVRNYLVIWVDGLHFTPVFMRKLGILSKKQKLVAHMGSHTLYFMHAGKYGSVNNSLHKWLLKQYDAFFCEGQMAADLIKSLAPGHPRLYTTFLGPESKRILSLQNSSPDLFSKNILLIAAGGSDFRVYYKGLDIMLDAFRLAYENDPDLRFTILGFWTDEQKNKLTHSFPAVTRNAIQFAGNVDNIQDYLSRSALYLHCSRGDAFPTSTVEAMNSGVPVIVSEWTGTKEIVTKVEKKFITPLDAEKIAQVINWYFDLDATEKQNYSHLFRKMSASYTEESAREHYLNMFNRFMTDEGLHQ